MCIVCWPSSRFLASLITLLFIRGYGDKLISIIRILWSACKRLSRYTKRCLQHRNDPWEAAHKGIKSFNLFHTHRQIGRKTSWSKSNGILMVLYEQVPVQDKPGMGLNCPRDFHVMTWLMGSLSISTLYYHWLACLTTCFNHAYCRNIWTHNSNDNCHVIPAVRFWRINLFGMSHLHSFIFAALFHLSICPQR